MPEKLRRSHHQAGASAKRKNPFRLGVSVSPVWHSRDAFEGVRKVARSASDADVSAFVVGDKSAGDSGVRSNSAVTTGLLSDLVGVGRIGCLFLTRQLPAVELLAAVRTVVDFVASSGSAPIIGLMHGRADETRPDAPAGVSEALAILRSEQALDGCELWIPAEAGSALERAAGQADVWLANAYYDSEALYQQLRVVEGGKAASAVRRDFICDSDSGRARAQRAELLSRGYRGGRFNESSLIAGSPAECIALLADVAALGFDDILVRPAVGGMAGARQCDLLLRQWHARTLDQT